MLEDIPECPPPLRERLPGHLTVALDEQNSPPRRSMGRGLLTKRPLQPVSILNELDSIVSDPESDSQTESEKGESENDSSDSEFGNINSSDTDSSGDELENAATTSFVSPSGEVWSQTPPPSQGRAASSNILRSGQGVTPYATQRIDEDAASSFKVIFDREMLDTVVYETNREGARVKGENWKPLTSVELDAYIGLCILRGVYKSKGESVRELWNPERGRKVFSSTMSLSRFEEIRRFLHFDNRETRSSRQQRDKLAAVRLLLDGVVRNSQKCYRHGACVTADEQLCGFRGRCRFIQYMPSKPARYGLKHFLLCDSDTFYCSNIILYTGKDDSRGNVALGEHLVMELCSHLFGSGRNVTCDNFFTSLSLARSLWKKLMTLVGTMKPNRREVPTVLRSTKDHAVCTSLFCYSTDGVQLVCYRAKKNKNVIVLSSQHRQPSVSATAPHKPDVILYYNSTKGGVDCLDERVATYSVAYKTRRWHVRVFCNLVDIAAFNAFVLFCEVFPDTWRNKRHRRRLFLTELGMSLSSNLREAKERVVLPIAAPPAQRGRCELCPRSADRKTQSKCADQRCRRFVCSEHSHTFCLDHC